LTSSSKTAKASTDLAGSESIDPIPVRFRTEYSSSHARLSGDIVEFGHCNVKASRRAQTGLALAAGDPGSHPH
jgi:hypothetical protein